MVFLLLAGPAACFRDLLEIFFQTGDDFFGDQPVRGGVCQFLLIGQAAHEEALDQGVGIFGRGVEREVEIAGQAVAGHVELEHVLQECRSQLAVGDVLVVGAGAHRHERRSAGVVVDGDHQVDVGVPEDFLALEHREVAVVGAAEHHFGAFLLQLFLQLFHDAQVDVFLRQAGRADGAGGASAVSGVEADGQALEAEVGRRMPYFEDEVVALIAEPVTPEVFFLEFDDERQDVAVCLLEIDIFHGAQFVVLGDPVAVVHCAEHFHGDGGRVEAGAGSIGETAGEGEPDAVAVSEIRNPHIVRVDDAGAA